MKLFDSGVSSSVAAAPCGCGCTCFTTCTCDPMSGQVMWEGSADPARVSETGLNYDALRADLEN